MTDRRVRACDRAEWKLGLIQRRYREQGRRDKLRALEHAYYRLDADLRRTTGRVLRLLPSDLFPGAFLSYQADLRAHFAFDELGNVMILDFDDPESASADPAER